MTKQATTGIRGDPDTLGGKLVIAGTRMPGELVLAKLAKLAVNPHLDTFFVDCPELSVDDVKTALRYAATTARGGGDRRSRARSTPASSC